MATSPRFATFTYNSTGVQPEVGELINKRDFSFSVLADSTTTYDIEYKISEDENATWRTTEEFKDVSGDLTATSFMPLFGFRMNITALTVGDVNLEIELK